MNKTLLETATLGAYAQNEPWPDVEQHYVMERALGVKLPVMSWFTTLENPWLTRQVAQAAASGHDLMICMEAVAGNARAPIPFVDILAGRWDRQLDRIFTQAATFAGSVTFRFLHEMNGNWYPWALDPKMARSTASIDIWLATWRYVVDRQRRIGGNVQWMWCVNSSDVGVVPVESYWPGADYVDVMSIDGYNGYAAWTSPAGVFQAMYDRLCKLDPVAKIWIAEIGCRPSTGTDKVTKSQWLQALFAMTTMPRVSTLVFFNSNQGHDWRITGDDVLSSVSGALQGATRASSR